MSRFKFDYRKVLKWFLPEKLGHPVMNAFLKAAITPIRRMYGEFHYQRKLAQYKLAHGQHVAHLEGVLNDRYDPAFRRIRIEDSALDYEPIWIYRANELKPVYLYQEAEDEAKYLFTEEETMFGGIDFVVEVPVSIPYNVPEMAALINDYKTPGMGYIIQDV